MKTTLYKKWLKLIKRNFKEHFMTRSKCDLCLLACRIWNIKLPEGYKGKIWIDLDIRANSKTSASVNCDIIQRLLINFKSKYIKKSRRYNTPEMKLKRVLLNGSED